MSQRFIRVVGVEMAPMREEAVLFNPANNQFCVLNKTAAFLWEQLQQPQSVDELCNALSMSFAHAEGSGVASDVAGMLAQMQQAACVTTTDD